VAATAATGLWLVGAAGAATVSVAVSDPGQAGQFSTATVTGTGEDVDDISVTLVGGTLDVVDSTAALTPGDGCVAVDAHTARCSRVSAVNVDGGAGNDRLAVVGATTGGVGLDGGPGDDAITGGPGNDSLSGGPGADTVVGGGGGDEAFVAIGEAGLEADRVELRDRAGTVHVDTRVAGATLDLAAGTLRLGSATVPILGARDATLGPAAGTLLGDDGSNQLQGAGVIDGRGGDDKLSGMPGPDRMVGGEGDDLIDASRRDSAVGGAGDDTLSAVLGDAGARGTLPSFACGAGQDIAVPAGTMTLVPLDCERTQVFSGLRLGAPRRVRGGITVRAAFPAGQCGVAAWARSSSGRRLTPRVQVRVGARATAVTLRLPVAASARAAAIAVYFSRPCPAGKRWAVGKATAALLALPRPLGRAAPR
jgi:Ca2+-binding RTX toxin-like protein